MAGIVIGIEDTIIPGHAVAGAGEDAEIEGAVAGEIVAGATVAGVAAEAAVSGSDFRV